MTDDGRQTPRPRESLVAPIVIPLGVLAVIAIVLWGFSRLLLHVRPHVATATALIMAIAIVVIVSIVASRKRVGNGSLLSVTVGVIGVGMLASGAALLVGAPTEEGGPEVAIALTAPADAITEGFAEKTLSAPSDTPFTIDFDNQEPQVQHNVVITSDDPAKDPAAQTFFTGQLVVGPGQAAYPVNPLAEGTYYFYCEVHPTTMNGTLTAAPGVPAGGPPSFTTEVIASGLAFDTSTLTFPADEKTTITFQNNDDQTPHDIAIFTDESATDELFKGETVTGVASATYDIPALKAGTYYFHCNFHPDTMKGTVNVIEAPPPPKDGGGGEPPPSGSAAPSGSP